MKQSLGFIFDMNGTMVDDMHFHADVWHTMLTEDLGAILTFADSKKQMYGKNSELLQRIFGPDKFTEAEMEHWSIEKEKRYQSIYLPHLKLIDGLNEFLAAAHEASIPMSIGSAAIPFNINFVLDNLQLHHYFTTVVSADDVAISKPHPETFLKAAEKMGVAPENCIVFEDAPKGVEAAANAGMKSVVLTTMHQKDEFQQYNNVLHFVPDYTSLSIEQFLK
ncbi:MAG: HAD family hydrolase [Chitinophagaceae bacterium]